MPYHHGDLRSAILAAAEELLREQGADAVTWRAIARRVGVSHAAPANHFDNLGHLLSELAAQGFERLTQDAQIRLDSAAGQKEHLHQLGSVYVEFAVANPELFALMFRYDLLNRGAPRLRAASAALLDVLATAIGGAEASELSVDAAAEMALAWAQVHGLAVLAIDGRLRALTARISPPMSDAEFLGRLTAL